MKMRCNYVVAVAPAFEPATRPTKRFRRGSLCSQDASSIRFHDISKSCVVVFFAPGGKSEIVTNIRFRQTGRVRQRIGKVGHTGGDLCCGAIQCQP